MVAHRLRNTELQKHQNSSNDEDLLPLPSKRRLNGPRHKSVNFGFLDHPSETRIFNQKKGSSLNDFEEMEKLKKK